MTIHGRTNWNHCSRRGIKNWHSHFQGIGRLPFHQSIVRKSFNHPKGKMVRIRFSTYATLTKKNLFNTSLILLADNKQKTLPTYQEVWWSNNFHPLHVHYLEAVSSLQMLCLSFSRACSSQKTTKTPRPNNPENHSSAPILEPSRVNPPFFQGPSMSKPPICCHLNACQQGTSLVVFPKLGAVSPWEAVETFSEQSENLSGTVATP